MKELDFNEIKEVSGGGTCICNNGAQWESCPHGGACHGWCNNGMGGVKYWGMG